MYEQWTPSVSKRKQAQRQRLSKRRWRQFITSLCLFVLVFAEAQPPFTTERLQSVFSSLGKVFSAEGTLWTELNQFGLGVLGFETEEGEEINETIKISTKTETQVEIREDSDLHSPTVGLNNPLWSEVFLPQTDTSPKDVTTFEEAIQVMTQLPAPQEEVDMPIGTILNQDNQDLDFFGISIQGLEGYEETHVTEHLYLGNRRMITPVFGVVTSLFGLRSDPFTEEVAMHSGVDIYGTEGTDILAWSDGVVGAVGETALVGRYLKIDHGDDIISFYAHCAHVLVTEGERVSAGEVIAQVGSTGQVTGAHLHFEIHYKDKYLNPLYYISYPELYD